MKKIIPQFHETIKRAGHNSYSTIFDTDQFANKKWSGKKIMEKAFEEIDKSDAVLFFVKSPEVSQGMLIELGYSLAKKKKVILAIQRDIKENIFRRQIENIMEFNDLEDLTKKLSKLNL